MMRWLAAWGGGRLARERLAGVTGGDGDDRAAAANRDSSYMVYLTGGAVALTKIYYLLRYKILLYYINV